MSKMLSNHQDRRMLAMVLGLFTVAALIATSTLWAQQPSREQMQQRAQQRMEELRTRLELSEDQEEQVKPILADGAKQMRELHEKYRNQERSRTTMQAMRSDMEKLQEQTRDQLTPILSEQQLAEYDALQKEWREQRRQQMGARGGQGGRGGPGGQGRP